MAYEVLARKWRPRQFDDVVGQGHVTQTLKNAISAKRIAHAYLFVGPRGIGKTSMARIFAKALNCEKGPTITPCDKCSSCQEIGTGTSFDVLEIDGASNNGVDQVRELRETVKYAPTRGSYKIYIIDEVHMLSPAAFNALLKTLEEPPPHVKFIFATTEPEKILATILSRCQRFDLRRIPLSLIVDRLKMIATAEKIKVEPDALLAIARGCEGGLRDALSALDQLVSFKGEDIKEEDVLSVFGLASRSMLENMSGAVLQGDIKSVIDLIGRLDETGKDFQRFVIELMGHFRNLIVWMHVHDASGMELVSAQIDTLKAQSAMTNAERVIRIADILGETENRMKYALSKRTLLETALIRGARAATVVSIEEILNKINALKEGIGNGSLSAANTQKDLGPFEKKEQGDREAILHSESSPGQEKATVNTESELKMLQEKWRTVVDKAGTIAVGCKSMLIDARPLSLSGNKVGIGFDPEFADELESMKIPRNRMAVEHAIGGLLKRTVAAEFCLSEIVAMDRLASGEKALKKDGTQAASGGEKGKSKNRRELIDDPAVQKALDVLDGSIMDVRE